MNINDLLRKDIMIMDMKASDKASAIDEMVASLAANNVINDRETFKEAIIKREEQTSTGLGDGIAMPHAKTDAVNEATVLFAKSEAGLDYEALDGQPTYLFFMIAVPDGANDTHLQTLAALSRMLIDQAFVSQLKQASTPEEVQRLFHQEENPAETSVDEQAEGEKTEEKPFVVAVTACPTGIAHTYMAEDALKKQAAEMGIDIRVETNGSDGAANALSPEEIKRAAGVIVAADKNVPMTRFNQKPVLERPVSEGINNAEELITKAMKGDAAIYHANEAAENEGESEASMSVWRKIYKDLMNGVSHMLPFVVGGGILMAVSFLLEGILGSDHELFNFFNTIGSNAFNFLIPILAGYIAMSIADRPGLMPGLVGGFMAVESNAGFLGGLVAGFLAGYLVLLVKRWFRNLPKSLDGLKSVLLYPVTGLLLIGLFMYFIIGPVFSTINTSMISFLENLGTGNAVILGALLGGMMAIDMGGPFNKAAYTFAIGIFTDTGDGSLMAAVMVGGMVPPIAIALATTFFKNKFSEQERESGLTNYVMGLSFITEGAIPFAAADPVRVIGSSVAGALIGGGLTQLWASSIPAPHGGIFVIPLAENALFFLVALAIGSVVAGIMLGIWKKTVRS
ncbi:PTS system D-fructose-specific IIA component (F1P-forming), Frc family /PTS system D-fructose-specific IIB component (F1P-forming), Frc family /PTS system D-fructose-specific IIC component (F1P-forming), Frc family [Lentibacillus persicus]|uniref:PTS system D-fructose-specific IIA component (F1P-forming), Frc family /PTS system D-fructose-specific IIB component (F1P-forming), Frc family /PTS system D-fructose-specific IIC component (F1P-for... n=1 Tax=Lentibacillus persicus TaxID=640948 RepID=A0A1I2ALL1_9BACI|nr:fructose-specific PTS transporter subunit EIIC [Lentibacillus persicus]SFE43760.1 PTS system D-fructose-specific IIA component (F1P-forming), Frc family /PTS system D-fructose-specific IIB component (F1P-forming), Frc family /PTS system D-fructose-specific IIC component (F1P-forming), Frc family [Lentibacillus persicus]